MFSKQLIFRQLQQTIKRHRLSLRHKLRWRVCLLKNSNNWKLKEQQVVHQLLLLLLQLNNHKILQQLSQLQYRHKLNLLPIK
jgi:hypothetical protein